PRPPSPRGDRARHPVRLAPARRTAAGAATLAGAGAADAGDRKMTAVPFARRHVRRRTPLPALEPEPAPPRGLVSIVICNHNYEHFVAAAVESALRQTYKPIEVIVIDDGSTDGSRERLQRFEEQVRLVFKSNRGQPSAVNAGFHESRGEIVC